MSQTPPPPPPPPQYPGGGGPGGSQYPGPGWYGPYGPQRDQPQATLALVLGIVSLVVCGLVAPFAWGIGRSSMREIDASGGMLGGRGRAQAGMIMGIIGTALLCLGIVIVIISIGVSVGNS